MSENFDDIETHDKQNINPETVGSPESAERPETVESPETVEVSQTAGNLESAGSPEGAGHPESARIAGTPETFSEGAAETASATDQRESTARLLSQLVDLGHRMSRFQHRGAKPWGDPRRGQGRVLAILKLKPEISQRELSFLLDMSKQSLAELLGKLEQRGLITREPSAKDRRVMLVRLTKEGEAAAPSRERGNAIGAELLESWTEEDLASLSGYLSRVIDKVEQHIEENEPEERRRRREEFQRFDEDFGRFGEEFGDYGPRRGRGRREWGPRDFGPRGPEHPRGPEREPYGPRGPREDGHECGHHGPVPEDDRGYGRFDDPRGRGRGRRRDERQYRGPWRRGF